MKWIFPLLLAASLTLGLTPLVRRLAIRVGAMDQPDKRKVHTCPMPRMGGLAIFFSFWITIFITQPITAELKAFAFGSLLILISGVWDDMKNIRPWMKLVFQFAAALVVILAGVKVTFITNLFSASPTVLGWLSVPFTMLWIVGMTNAVNLVDGLDGLAAGVSAIAALSIGIIAWMEGFASVGYLSILLASSTFAFLKYNFHPAKIFMGDTGALFLGYALAVISILGLTKMATTVSLFLPVVVLGVPIMDTLFAIVRRLTNRMPIFAADKDHLHHRLLAMGFSHTQAVLVVYGVCLFLSLSAIGISLLPTGQAMMAIGVVAVVGIWAAEKVGVLGRQAKAAAAEPSSQKKSEIAKH
ncbi:MAG: MraY family glycosyltransferase [Peptococcaceae bacterium]|nr:MraY family glycosyltransferase [Peptococcaceae bacterium]